jgi:uncharacterized protein YaaQ
MNKVCARVLEGTINIIGIAETKLDTKMACVIQMCQNIDQTISSQQSTSEYSNRVTRIRVSATRGSTSTSGPG